MIDLHKVNTTLLVAGVVVNVICVYVYGNIFAKSRELSTNVASDLISQCGRSIRLMLVFLVFLPAYCAFRWTLGRFLFAALNFRSWGIQRIIGVWSLHFCILAILLVSDFYVSGYWLTAILGSCLLQSIILAVVVSGWMQSSAKVQIMGQKPTDETVSAVIALGKKALPVLLIVIENGDYNARTAAAYAVGQIGIRTLPIIDALEVASVSTDEILREAAEAALRRLTLPLAID